MRREFEQFGSWALAWLCLRYVLGATALAGRRLGLCCALVVSLTLHHAAGA
jgi:hypothetical protein